MNLKKFITLDFLRTVFRGYHPDWNAEPGEMGYIRNKPFGESAGGISGVTLQHLQTNTDGIYETLPEGLLNNWLRDAYDHTSSRRDKMRIKIINERSGKTHILEFLDYHQFSDGTRISFGANGIEFAIVGVSAYEPITVLNINPSIAQPADSPTGYTVTFYNELDPPAQKIKKIDAKYLPIDTTLDAASDNPVANSAIAKEIESLWDAIRALNG